MTCNAILNSSLVPKKMLGDGFTKPTVLEQFVVQKALQLSWQRTISWHLGSLSSIPLHTKPQREKCGLEN